MSIKGFEINNEIHKIDYEELDNLPFYEKEGGEEEETIQITPLFDGDGAPIPFDYSIGLIAGKNYVVTNLETESIETCTAQFAGIGEAVSIACETFNFILGDKITIDPNASSDAEATIFNKSSFIVLEDSGATYSITGTFSPFKQVDKKFLPDDIATKLEVATSTTLGGVMPVEKTSAMTQSVGVDEEGKLYAEVPEVNIATNTTTGIVKGSAAYTTFFTEPCSVDSAGAIFVQPPTTTTSITQNSTSIPTAGAVYDFLINALAESEY